MSVLTDYLTSIADAIRNKKGTTELIPASNFAEEIASIETGSEPVLVELNATANGIYVPGEGVDGYNNVTVNVPSIEYEYGVVVNEFDTSGKWVDVTVYGDVQPYAFYYQTELERVTLVNCTTIGKEAFRGCTRLESITMPDSVMSIGDSPFYGCKALTALTIPASLTKIGSKAFNQITGLTHITIPDWVTSIGTYAFYGCTALASVQIGTSDNCEISSIATNTFDGCKALTDITIYKTTDAVSGSPWGAPNATVTWALEE